MTSAWGRAETAGTWPHPKPVRTLAVLLVASVSGLAVAAYAYAQTWTPLQRVYLGAYVRSAVMAAAVQWTYRRAVAGLTVNGG